jgi:hypothetical protein
MGQAKQVGEYPAVLPDSQAQKTRLPLTDILPGFKYIFQNLLGSATTDELIAFANKDGWQS